MASGDDYTPDSTDTPDLNKTLDQAEAALKLGTGRLDDPRIKTSTETQTATQNQPEKQPRWMQAPVVKSNQSGVATTFATPSDISAYNEAKARGASEEQALEVGDNGIGSKYLGEINTTIVYGVAVPEQQLIDQFGNNPEAWRKARAVVKMGGQNVIAPIVDVGPGQSAQARGVVTDLTGPLAQALKSQGSDPAEISIIADAGPDYKSDPRGWYDEQKKIRQSLPGAGKWANAPFAAQPESKEEVTPKWKMAPVVPQGKQNAWEKAPISSNHPLAKENGWTLGQSIQNIWDVAKLANAKASYGLAQSQVTTDAPDAMVQQQLDSIKASPYLTDEQKQQNIAALQQGQQKEWAYAHAQLPQLKQQISDSEKELQKNHANDAEKVIGSTLPYLVSSVTGPLAPFVAAQQATAETYGETLDTSVKKLKELHPTWDDGKVVTQAVKAATEASAGSGEAMLALSVVDVPAAGPIIARIAQKIGIGAATMEVANSFAEVQKNMALKKDVDPSQDWLGQLRNIEFHVQNIAAGGAFGGLHGLGGEIGRPSADPIEDRVPIAEVPEPEQEQKKPESKEPEKIVAAASKRGEEVRTGTTHFEAEEDWGLPEKRGFMTNTGRFVSREEAYQIAAKAKQAKGAYEGAEGRQLDATMIDPATIKERVNVLVPSTLEEPPLEPPPKKEAAWQHQYQGDTPPTPSGEKAMYFSEKGSDFYPDWTANNKPGTGTMHADLDLKNPAIESQLKPEDYQKVADIWKANGGDSATIEEWLKQAKSKSGDQWWSINKSPGLREALKQAGYDGVIVDDSHKAKWAISLDPPTQVKSAEHPEPPPEKPTTGTEPWLSSIANRYTQERSAQGQLGEVTQGAGTTPQEMVAKGLQMGPERIAQHVSDLMAGKGDMKEQAAAVRAREAQLSQDANKLGRIAEANPNDPQAQANYEEAFQHLTDFHNGPVAKLKNNWHAAGEAMQGELPVDLGSFNGLREAWLRDVGREPSERVQKTMRDTAKKVRETSAAEDVAMKRLGEEIKKQTTRRKLPTYDEVRDGILKEMNGDRPCGI
jgi:hypothetical protein